MLRTASSFLHGLQRLGLFLRAPSGFLFAFVGMLSLVVLLCLISSRARAGQIWTDGNGDGLPDFATPIVAQPSSNVTIGVWIDAQSFSWTNFLAYIEWSGDCISYVTASYVITGGSNFPIDDFSHPRGVGFGGAGYAQGGIDQIGNVVLHVDTPVPCCVTPIIDIYNPYYVFSQLGAGSAYMLFSTNPGTCFNGESPCGNPCGACCFPTGFCQEITAAQCAAADGIYMGDGSSCGAVVCEVLPTGACCVPPLQTCTDATEVACSAMGGVYQGNDTSCGAITCPPPTGACCVTDTTCEEMTQSECSAVGGTFRGNGTRCDAQSCSPPRGACCVIDSCYAGMTASQCTNVGGIYRGNGSICQPNLCDTHPGCRSFSAPGTAMMRERFAPAQAPKAEGIPCLLTGNTNGTAENYRWYNVCSGYIWIYSGWRAGEGVGTLYGGAENPAVDCSNDVKRTITYYRNVCPNYNYTVDVYLDAATANGCVLSTIASDLNLDPGLRWNCSDLGANIPFGVNYVVVRTQHDGGSAPSLATDGPFSAACDPSSPARSFYYGLNGSACVPWVGPDKDRDNFLNWLILDVGTPCLTAVEPTSWGRIKGLFR